MPFLLLRRYGTELPSGRPFVHVGVGAASMSIIGRWMAIADGRRMAAVGEGLRWRQRGIRLTGVKRRTRRYWRRQLGIQCLARRCGRSDDGQYARLEAHGFYWTASESDPASGWFYNFGRGGQALHRQSRLARSREHFPFGVVRE